MKKKGHVMVLEGWYTLPKSSWADTGQQLLGSSPTGSRDRVFGKVSTPLNLNEVLIRMASEGMDSLALLHPGAAAPQEQ